jgi:hypothetical protein
MNTMMRFAAKYRMTFIGIALGAIGGYLYYHFIGCANGTCAITSNPVNSTLYGTFVGGFLFNMFDGKDSKKQ